MCGMKENSNAAGKSHPVRKKISVTDFLRMTEKYDVISFDVFDTLILRAVGEPADVFSLMEREMGIADFRKNRIKAEKTARQRTYLACGSKETDLDCIYAVMRDEYGTDRRLSDLEIATEGKVCVANPYFLEIYRRLAAAGKEIIAVTDMYLPEQTVREILARCGYDKVSALFVSCSFRKGKGDGSLQRFVKENYVRDRTALHIGDNYDSDVLQTRKCGMDAYYYPGVREDPGRGDIFQTDGLENVFYQGIVRNSLCNGLSLGTADYDYGFQFLGTVAYGFCRWLETLSRKREADYVLFCGEDCGFFHSVFQECIQGIRTGYVSEDRQDEDNLNDVPEGLAFPLGNAGKDAVRILSVEFGPAGKCSKTELSPVPDDMPGAEIVARVVFFQYAETEAEDERTIIFLSVPEFYAESFLEDCRAFSGKTKSGNKSASARREKTTGVETEELRIREIQAGILDFVRQYDGAVGKFGDLVEITPKASAGPLFERYAAVHETGERSGLGKGERKKVLLVSHEFTYTGAPHSLLRMATVMRDAGCAIEVWGPEKGPFLREFKQQKIRCRILPLEKLQGEEAEKLLKGFDLAVINTVYADRYYESIKGIIPSVWVIREASDLESCCKNAPERLNAVKNAGRIYCVSEYAAGHLKKYNTNIRVLRNCVEDFSGLSEPYDGPRNGIVKFIQLGTLEERKGYDLILDAYCLLPDSLKSRTEICFAGKLPDFQKSYWTDLLERLKGFRNIRYLGEIRDTKRKIQVMSGADVVVVASRDEACSLVALEGAMLSKPLLLSTNVGAKYMVRGGNGLLFESGDARSLARGMEYFLKNVGQIKEMGEISRRNYLEMACMDRYREDVLALLHSEEAPERNRGNIPGAYKTLSGREERSKGKTENSEEKKDGSGFFEKVGKVCSYCRENGVLATIRYVHGKRPYLFFLTCGIMDFFRDEKKRRHFRKYRGRNDKIIVSVTSYPDRIHTVAKALESIFRQWLQPDAVWLVLSEEQFPGRERDLPKELLALRKKGLVIRWVERDLKAHKNYFYAARDNRNCILITMDDDVLYERDVTGTLYESYLKHPDCISCMRAQRITQRDGRIAWYGEWKKDASDLYGKSSHETFALGSGGILYPPDSLPEETFDVERILENSLNASDLWLKFMELKAGRKVVLAGKGSEPRLIAGTQDNALYFANAFRGGYDQCLALLLEKFPEVEQVLTKNLETGKGF